MNLKRRCCCDFPAAPIRYIEVEPVIAIPEQCILVGNLSWWVDLNDVVEVSPGFVLYEGGDASSFGQPITVSDDPVFVWNDSDPTVWWSDNDITGGTNLGKIFSLRHRGWRIKQGGRRVDFQGLAEVGGTRIVWDLPSAASDDLIDQVQDGGFFFLPQEFSDTPALVQQRSSTDFNGDAVTFTVGYNPRKECVKPEQGRYYGSAAHQRLLFDFTAQFPNSLDIQFFYPGTGTISTTFSKFVLGGQTRPTATGVFPSTVTGFTDEDPDGSELIKFGYRTASGLSTGNVRAPSIPLFWLSAGSDEFRAGGQADCFLGDGANGLLPATQQNSAASFNFQKTRVGDILQDITYYPLAQVETNTNTYIGVPSDPGPGVPYPLRSGNSPSGALLAYFCSSYKGAVAIDNNYTASLTQSIVSNNATHDLSDLMTVNYATNNAGRVNSAIPTDGVPVFAWGTDPTVIRVETFSNPLDGVNHGQTPPGTFNGTKSTAGVVGGTASTQPVVTIV